MDLNFKLVGFIVAVILLVTVLLFACGSESSDFNKTEIDVNGLERKSDLITEAECEPEKIEKYPVSLASYTENTANLSDDFGFCAGIVINLKKNEVLAASNAEEKIYPASLTKIMTLIVAVENCRDLNETFIMTADILDPLVIENASIAGFSAGEKVTVKDMLYGLMLPSGADAAVGLAEVVAGSETEFVKLMNKKVSELGLKNTRFQNSSGLHHPDHYSTCHEMAKILEYAVKNKTMREVMSTYQYTTASTEQHPDGILLTSTLFSRMYGNEPDHAFVVGGKTGYTLEAHHCLATFAVSCTEDESEASIYAKDPEYVLVTVGSTDKWGPIFNAIDIYSAVSADKPYGKIIEPAKK